MSVDAKQLEELTGIFESIWAEEQSLTASQEISREIIKEKKGDLKGWAESKEIDPKMVLAIYDQYKKAQQGKISINSSDATGHVAYEDLLFQIFEFLRTHE